MHATAIATTTVRPEIRTIFISYRRSDAGGHAGRLFDRLSHWFDADTLFYDRQTIGSGENFPERIQSALDRAAVVLVVIGPDWVDEINVRLAKPGVDFVRHEVARALAARKRGAEVIPVLMNGATMPLLHQLDEKLHDAIAELCPINALAFVGENADYDNQFIRLRERIAAVPGLPAARYLPPPGEERPWRVIDHSVSPHFQDPNGLLPQLHTQLETSGSTALVAPAALFGMGGVGKTQLALKYCLDYRDLYAGIWWFRAETDTTLQLDALDCCIAVGTHVKPDELPTAALKRWLARQSTPWLLVFDNADNSDNLRPHLPQGGLHRVVITSRSPAWNGIAQALALTAWTPEQGADFLSQRLPGRNRAELLALATDLGGLPLALEQAAAYIETTAIAIPTYRELLAAIDTEGLILDEGRAATGYERSVLATLSLAFAKLTPAAAQLLRLLAYAAPEALPERFLQEGAEELPTELTAALGNALAWNRLVGELRSYALVERSEMPALDREPGEVTTRTEPALSLHRLTQQALRAKLAKGEEDCRKFQAVLHTACRQDTNCPAYWARFAVLGPHVTGLDHYLDFGWLDRISYPWLLNQIANYLSRGTVLYGEAVHWFRHALQINQQELGLEHDGTLAVMNNLAAALLAQGDLAGAIELQKSVLATCCRVLGGEHPRTLTPMNNLAESLRAQGDLAGALKLNKSVVAIQRRVLGEEHPATLTSMNNFANTLYAQGDLAGALELQKSVLAIQRRVLGEEHPYTLKSKSNLALTLHAQGDLAGALELQKSALTIQRCVLGEEHPDTLTSKSNLALTLHAQGDLAGAAELNKSVLAICRRELGEEHPATLTSMSNLASTLNAQGDLAGALELEKSALAIQRRVLGEDHPATLQSMGNLATTHQAQGNLVSALELNKSALAIRRRVLGEEHPDTLSSMGNLAATLRDQGDLAGALELQRSALAIRRRVLGAVHNQASQTKVHAR